MNPSQLKSRSIHCRKLDNNKLGSTQKQVILVNLVNLVNLVILVNLVVLVNLVNLVILAILVNLVILVICTTPGNIVFEVPVP